MLSKNGRPSTTWQVTRPGPLKPFESIDTLLEAAQQMFLARQYASDVEKPKSRSRADAVARDWSRYFHHCEARTSDNILLCRRLRAEQLSEVEKEIICALLLVRLSLVDDELDNCAELFRFMRVTGTKAVQLQRTLSDNGALRKSGLVTLPEPDDEIRSSDISLCPHFSDDILHNHDSHTIGWRVANEEELYEKLAILNRAFQANADDWAERRARWSQVERRPPVQRIQSLWRGFAETLRAHLDWKINAFLSQEGSLDNVAQRLLVILLGRELGQLRDAEGFCTGQNMSQAVSKHPAESDIALEYFRPDSPLIAKDLIQPCEGKHTLISDDIEDLSEIQFELTAKSLDMLQLKRRRARARDAGRLREGKLCLDQVVMSASVRSSIDMALAQARHQKVLMNDWGLAESFSYGRGVTLLLSGPPGVGKTAVGEAMARELGRPILVIDYSQVQNCFVGQTEKNIARMFSLARQHSAVLFWDEADAMFFDRGSSQYNWEVREVNVLLQELEKFDGVCILATNRTVTLDAALERRIGLKIVFERPDQTMRMAIWRRLMPPKLPVSNDVKLEELAKTDLTGGEIKNVILNASRMALARDHAGPVTIQDFRNAISMEVRGRWGECQSGVVGFGAHR